MTTTFELAVVLYALGVAAICAVTAVRGRPRGPMILPALIVIQIATLVQAVFDATELAAGPLPAETATHVGYLIVSVVVLPITAGSVRLGEDRWGTAALAIGCVLVAVVSIRLHQTLAPARHG